jgi:succinate-semialdehyde dehydrogenase/glutarate-semialdehyde dehydrogenase
MGPVANVRRLASIEALVNDAKSRGARVAAGGFRIGEHGYFYAPTVLADVPLDASAMSHRPFGPLGLCVSVRNSDEGLALANSLSAGLSAYASTNSSHDAERITLEPDCRVLSINNFGAPGADAPFGRIKETGMGREGGAESFDAYLVSKTVLQRTTVV